MAKKVLLADTNIGQLGLVQAGTIVDTAEQRYTLLHAAEAPFADYDPSMDDVIAAYQNQARILPQGRDNIDLASALEAAGLWTPPAVADLQADVTAAQADITAIEAAQTTDEANIAANTTALANREVLPNVLATQTGSPIAAAIDTLIPVDCTSGVRVVNLPAITSGNKGHKIIVKKVDVGTNDVTVNPSAGQTIDGQASFTIAGTGSGKDLHFAFYSNGGTNWLSI